MGRASERVFGKEVSDKPAPDPQVEHLVWLSAQMSAAALGHLRHDEPYAGKPLAPVEEILRLRLAARTLAESVARRIYGQTFTPADVDTIFTEALNEAAEQLPIPYAKPKEEGG